MPVRNDSEKGNLMLMTLMVLLVLSVLGAAVIGVAGMENKVSRYGVQLLQAQQAADAGVDWAIEEIWRQGLPLTLSEQIVLGDRISSQITVLEKTVESLTDSAGNGEQAEVFECSYRFTSAGEYHGITKEVAVEVVYTYTGDDPASYDSVEIRSYASKS